MRSKVFVAALFFLSCTRAGDDGGGVDAGAFDKGALLRSLGECALSTYREYHAAAVELDGASRRAESEGTPAARDAARDAWKKAIDAWQRAEIFKLGPAALHAIPGGKDMRDAIYAWPLVNRCTIEEQIVSQAYDAALGDALVSSRGLGAAEYLLFYDGVDNACPPTSAINAAGQWAALGAP
ncbi:MAG: hypothetical protein KF819_30075, partial [Labilithrix sp.]|nr:hypothetical protein [Labilithrix sp.]